MDEGSGKKKTLLATKIVLRIQNCLSKKRELPFFFPSFTNLMALLAPHTRAARSVFDLSEQKEACS